MKMAIFSILFVRKVQKIKFGGEEVFKVFQTLGLILTKPD
jgi:hypothetical protein